MKQFFRARGERLPSRGFWIYFSGATLYVLGFSVYFFLLNLYLLEKGADEGKLGLYGTLLAIGSMAGTLPVGVLARRFGIRTVLCFAVPAAAVAASARVLLPNAAAQMILAPLEGAMMCAWAICLSPAVAAQTTERTRSLGFSIMFSSGIGLAGLGGWLAGRAAGWFPQNGKACVMLIGCALSCASVMPLLRLPATAVGDAQRERPAFANPFLRRILPALALWALVTVALPPFATVYFVRHVGVSLQRLGTIYSASQAVQVVAVLAAPLLFRRIGRVAGIVSTQLVTAAGLGLLAACKANAAAYVFCVYMGAQYMNEPGIYSLLMDKVPAQDRSAISSAVFFVSSLAQAAAPMLIGISLLRFGYPVVLASISALAVLSAAAFWLTCRTADEASRAGIGLRNERIITSL